jgi:hypothetical protein
LSRWISGLLRSVGRVHTWWPSALGLLLVVNIIRSFVGADVVILHRLILSAGEAWKALESHRGGSRTGLVTIDDASD